MTIWADGQQLHKLKSDVYVNCFGFSVGISGSTIVVGHKHAWQDNGTRSGAVYIFNTAGDRLHKLLDESRSWRY